MPVENKDVAIGPLEVWCVTGRRIIPMIADRMTAKCVYIEGKRRNIEMGEASFHKTEEEAKEKVKEKTRVFIENCNIRIQYFTDVRDIAMEELER